MFQVFTIYSFMLCINKQISLKERKGTKIKRVKRAIVAELDGIFELMRLPIFGWIPFIYIFIYFCHTFQYWRPHRFMELT